MHRKKPSAVRSYHKECRITYAPTYPLLPCTPHGMLVRIETNTASIAHPYYFEISSSEAAPTEHPLKVPYLTSFVLQEHTLP